ncbi:hypothetical protein [Endozoicomonas sp.]|uniref:hypothetical protein n=1 Tax=Endozoicomonas sp. TaxID=1892382 RepID=UPI002888485E|nr:hypothetical protein [Endozoicomonas sp.]
MTTGKLFRKKVDISQTKENIFIEKSCANGSGSGGDFHTINLTEVMNDISDAITGMSANSGTAIYEGIIRGAQIVSKGKNARRLIIILSDGDDSGDVYNKTADWVHEELNGVDYCGEIRTTLDTQEVDGIPVQSTIAVVGVDYNATSNPNLQTCAGKGNVFDARNADELYDIIIGLIAEEIGHLHTLPDA